MHSVLKIIYVYSDIGFGETKVTLCEVFMTYSKWVTLKMTRNHKQLRSTMGIVIAATKNAVTNRK